MTQERELDTGLNDGELSRLYAEAPQIEPPEHLDVAILAEAHRAVSARPAGSHKRRWAIPLGLVASLFVVVMVGLQLPYMLREPSPLQAPAPASVAPRTDESAAEPAPAKMASGEASTADKSAVAANKSVVPLAEAPKAPPAPVAAPEPAMAARQLELREREESASTGAFAKEKKSAYMGASNDELKQPAPAATVAAPPPAKLERALMKDDAGAVALRPDEWLKRIEKLKQEGKTEEARKELEAFRKRHPDIPIPAGLK